MSDKFTALVVETNDIVEEEVTLRINGSELTCFACVCPYEIHTETEYGVELELMVFDECEVVNCSDDKPELERIGDSFSYYVRGVLEGNMLKTKNLTFTDDIFWDYTYLENQRVEIKVDRFDVEFL